VEYIKDRGRSSEDNIFYLEKNVKVYEIVAKIRYQYVDPRKELAYFILNLGDLLNGIIDERSTLSFFGVPTQLVKAIIRYMVEEELIEPIKKDKISLEPHSKLKGIKDREKIFLFNTDESTENAVFKLTDNGINFSKGDIPCEDREKYHTFYLVSELGFILPKEDLINKESEESKISEGELIYMRKFFDHINSTRNEWFGLPKNIISIDTKNFKILHKFDLTVRLKPIVTNKRIDDFYCSYITSKTASKKNRQREVIIDKNNFFIEKVKNNFTEQFQNIETIGSFLIKHEFGKELFVSGYEIKNNTMLLHIILDTNEDLHTFIRRIFETEHNEKRFKINRSAINDIQWIDIELKTHNSWRLKTPVRLLPKSPIAAKCFSIINFIDKVRSKMKEYEGLIDIEKVLEESYEEISKIFKGNFEKPTIEHIRKLAWEEKFFSVVKAINEWSMINNVSGYRKNS